MTEAQVKAILDLKLHRLTGLERDKIGKDLQQIVDHIKYLLTILNDKSVRDQVIKSDILAVKEAFATPRKTQIIDDEYEQDIEDLIQKEDMVVTVSQNNYIKRVPLSSYQAQKRGGKGKSGMATKGDDVVRTMFVANTHTAILIFTNFGKVYKLKVYQLPHGNPQGKGKPLVQVLSSLDVGEKISTIMPLPEDLDADHDHDIVFATSHGSVRRNKLSDFVNVNANGKIAMKFSKKGETLVDVQVCDENHDVFLASQNGRCVRFSVQALRVFFSRNSSGVRGINLQNDDRVISMSILDSVDISTEEREAFKSRRGISDDESAPDNKVVLSDARFAELEQQEQLLLCVSSNGYGKITSSYEYRSMGRGIQGISVMNLSERNGKLVTAFSILADEEVVLISSNGQTIRCSVSSLRIMGRATQGVKLFNVAKDESVVAVARLESTVKP
jgi:DNA gyrase subunit A